MDNPLKTAVVVKVIDMKEIAKKLNLEDIYTVDQVIARNLKSFTYC